MKRNLSFILLLATILCGNACRKTEEFKPTAEKKIEISFTNTASSKSTVEDDELGNLLFKWESGDELYVYDGTKLCGTLKLDKDGAGKKTAKFSGKTEEPEQGATELTFYYLPKSAVPDGENATVIDYQNQEEGDISVVQKFLTAGCTAPYKQGQTSFSGELTVKFAIGKFDLSDDDFVSGEGNIQLKGCAQKISISQGGEMSYITPDEGEPFAKLDYRGDDSSYYFILPCTETSNKLTLITSSSHKYNVYNYTLKNNVFYRGDEGQGITTTPLEEHRVTVTYKYKDSASATSYKSSTTTVECKDIENNKIPLTNETYYWQDGKETWKEIIGWSETEGTTEPKYVKGNDIPVDGRDAVTLFAVWKDMPYVAFDECQWIGVTEWTSVNYLPNTSVKYNFTTNGTFERLNIPIYNLEPKSWYYLTFSDTIARKDGGEIGFSDAGLITTGVWKDSRLGSGSDDINIKHIPNEPDWGAYLYNFGNVTSQNEMRIPFYVPKENYKTNWLWDLSRLSTNIEYYIDLSLKSFKVEKIILPENGYVNLLKTSFYGFKNNSASLTEHSYKQEGEAGDKPWVIIRLATSGDYEKINVPLKLMSGHTYSMNFTVKYSGNINTSNHYFSYKVQESENTDISGTPYGTNQGYTEFKPTIQELQSGITDQCTFTATKDEMFWAWNVSKMQDSGIFELKVNSIIDITTN